MKIFLRKNWVCLLAYVILFPVLGIFAPFEIAPFMLLLFNPLFTIGISLGYAVKYGFKWYAQLYAPVLFLPVCFISYNESALFYVPCYLAASLVGAGIGCAIRSMVNRNTKNTK